MTDTLCISAEEKMEEAPYNVDLDHMFMRIAVSVALRTKPGQLDNNQHVGCAIRRSGRDGQQRQLIGVGWNDTLYNSELSGDEGDHRRHLAATCECAERNALDHLHEDAKYATVYTTHLPCV